MNKNIKKLAQAKADKDKGSGKGRMVPLDYVDPAVGPRSSAPFSDFSGKNAMYRPGVDAVVGGEGPIRASREYSANNRLSKKTTFRRDPTQRFDTMYRSKY